MVELNDQAHIRRQRRQNLLTAGVEVYPARTAVSTSIAHLLKHWREDQTASVAGRVRAMRIQGGSAFVDLDDGTDKIQLFFQKRQLGEVFQQFSKQLDLGDFIQAGGQTFRTKAGERSIGVQTVSWLGKALRPLPSHWHGLEDVELRYRHRELDLLTNPETKDLFRKRSIVTQTIRQFLLDHQFLEVETPILQPLAGGANAQPFVTHHQALDSDLFLRIAPELYLKRLVIGGFNQVFEVARCFRNEGIDRDHNPEFTQVELYAAYRDYYWLMDLLEQLLPNVALAVNGQAAFVYDHQEVPLHTPFSRLTYRQALLDQAHLDLEDTVAVKKFAHQKLADHLPPQASPEKILDEVFKTFVRPHLIQPTIVYEYPTAMIPLAKKKTADPRYVECFQLIMGGTEVVKAFSEVNDPVDQRERFEAQEALRAKGDSEAQHIDEDYLQALEYGLPPTAGLGLGIDRLTALLTGQHNLKDVILFPTLKPKP